MRRFYWNVLTSYTWMWAKIVNIAIESSAGFVNDRNNFLPVPSSLHLLHCLTLFAQITFRNKWTGTITWLTQCIHCVLTFSSIVYLFVCFFMLNYNTNRKLLLPQHGWKQLLNQKWEVAVRFINFHPDSSWNGCECENYIVFVLCAISLDYHHNSTTTERGRVDYSSGAIKWNLIICE